MLTGPGGAETGGEGVALVAGRAGADGPVLPHQTLSVHSAGGGRTLRGLQQAVPALLLYLAGILAAEVEAGKVVRTLPVIETLTPPRVSQTYRDHSTSLS